MFWCKVFISHFISYIILNLPETNEFRYHINIPHMQTIWTCTLRTNIRGNERGRKLSPIITKSNYYSCTPQFWLITGKGLWFIVSNKFFKHFRYISKDFLHNYQNLLLKLFLSVYKQSEGVSFVPIFFLPT